MSLLATVSLNRLYHLNTGCIVYKYTVKLFLMCFFANGDAPRQRVREGAVRAVSRGRDAALSLAHEMLLH